jgi:hypothetical protein
MVVTKNGALLFVQTVKKTNSKCTKYQAINQMGYCGYCSSKPPSSSTIILKHPSSTTIILKHPGPSTNLPNDATTQNTLGTYVVHMFFAPPILITPLLH